MKKIINFLAIVVLLFGCSENQSETKTNRNPVLPNSSGKTGEVLVVIGDDVWKGKVGDTVFYTLSEPFEGLPQDESFFNVIHVPPSAFKNIFKTHRNIIIVRVNREISKPKVERVRNKWANQQLVYYFYAPDEESFFKLWHDNVNTVMNEIFMEELSRYQQAFEKFQNKEAEAIIKKKYHVSLLIPSEYNLDVQKDHFCWISRETEVSSQGIFIYDYPYTDTNTFTLDYLVAKRDEITKKNVPGPKDGSYMQTEKRVPLFTEEIDVNGQYGFLIRGLWYTENYFLGGPFVSITVLDKKRNRVVTVESYVYAGKQNKKLYLWQTEAILRTLKIVD